jgi:hypothetical protein
VLALSFAFTPGKLRPAIAIAHATTGQTWTA